MTVKALVVHPRNILERQGQGNFSSPASLDK